MHCTDPEELLYAAKVSLWMRCLVLAAIMVEINYRVDYGTVSHLPNIISILSFSAFNGFTLFLVHRKKAVTPLHLGGLSIMDVAMVSFGVFLSGGFSSPYFPTYYFVVATISWVFTSPRLGFLWTTLVVVVYIILSVAVDPGINIAEQEEKHLIWRILAMYVVGGVVSLIARFQRTRRRRGMERERELQRQRVEISKTIHDTTAQSAYMIVLGLETAMELADKNNQELIAKLQATADLSISAMWELKHPINGGQIFKGKELGHVLKAHAETFTAITSVPAELVQRGPEPSLSQITRSLLFSIAHNALTNALRHSHATKVTIELDFRKEGLRMSLTDDGVGLPDDYSGRGHGFKNMRAYARRLGGRLNIGAGKDGRGTAVTCVVQYNLYSGGQ